jgi:hypothetical protein
MAKWSVSDFKLLFTVLPDAPVQSKMSSAVTHFFVLSVGLHGHVRSGVFVKLHAQVTVLQTAGNIVAAVTNVF